MKSSDPHSPPADLAGWRGGIGIAFGEPSHRIPDVLELGYEIAWGVEKEPAAVVSTLDLAMFRYWNSVVEISLKDPDGRYDFSDRPDKQQAAERAFDAWAEQFLGVPGLSRCAQVEHRPQGAYGDVGGTLDYAADNPLVAGLIESYLKWFADNGVRRGGIALDNAGKIPAEFLDKLRQRFGRAGLGIATNGCPEELLPSIDLYGEEGFPFPVARARAARAAGFRGVLAEYTMQHLAAGDLAAYLRAKLFNRIVFFGYTNGGTAAGAGHSFYAFRPDVYHHQRWVFRKYVALSRAVQQAGEQSTPFARIDAVAGGGGRGGGDRPGTATDGKVYEWDRKYDVPDLLTQTMGDPFVIRFGADLHRGLYLHVSATGPADIVCDGTRLGLDDTVTVFDEFAETLLPHQRDGRDLRFRTSAGPALVQLGARQTIARNLLARIETLLTGQRRQRKWNREHGLVHPLIPWAGFCGGYAVDETTARSGRASLRATGGTYGLFTGKYQYYRREGAAQLVMLDQTAPSPVTLRAWSRSNDVPRSEPVPLSTAAERDHHFSAREGHTYAVHLYLDYQDGAWPAVHTATFSPGTHDWEERVITVTPSRPVRTAMVLLELHQPSGTAWFDDLVLTSADRPAANLLLCAGFESDAALHERATRQSDEYEQRLDRFQEHLQAAIGSLSAGRVADLQEELATLRAWLTEIGLNQFWGYESRDLSDAAHQLRLGAGLLGG
ncbi:hypothetical protein HQ590_16190 [bacterium]|nr:hypothetical protein [bacterium]